MGQTDRRQTVTLRLPIDMATKCLWKCITYSFKLATVRN